MTPFTNFNHFIAFFVPGIFLTAATLAIVSMFVGTNVLPFAMALRPEASIIYVIVSATLFGLFLDESRHRWIELRMEDKWAASKEYNGWDDLAEDFIVYVSSPDSKVTLQAYLAMVDEFYYFYEFDVNMSLALIAFALVISFYLERFYMTWYAHGAFLILLPIVLLAGARLFWVFGKDAYEYFLTTFTDAMSRNDPDFKKTLVGQ